MPLGPLSQGLAWERECSLRVRYTLSIIYAPELFPLQDQPRLEVYLKSHSCLASPFSTLMPFLLLVSPGSTCPGVLEQGLNLGL